MNSEGRSDIGIPSLALGSCLCAVVKPDAGSDSGGSECPPHLATAQTNGKWPLQVTALLGLSWEEAGELLLNRKMGFNICF